METRIINQNQQNDLLKIQEDHFHDIKSKKIAPTKLQETFVAFANADGGEVWIGIEDEKVTENRIQGFNRKEEANDILHTLLELTNPSVENVEVEFLQLLDGRFVLYLTIPKSPKVHYCANGDCFIRINARKEKIKGDKVTQLGYAKGAFIYEKQPVDITDSDDYKNNPMVKNYMNRVGSTMDPILFLKKQRLLTKKDSELKPNVACVLMFEEEPQATLDTRCAVKVYRLLTSESEYKREQLKSLPKTINGPIERQIVDAINEVQEQLKDSSVMIDGQLQKLNYPSKAIHEILVNAVVHRDYSLNDDIHVKIFDNRIEVLSPGRLPGYMTIENIYDERFSRNPNLVRMLHNLPNPLNHDFGEGLDTVRNEMKKAGLVDPVISESGNSVTITIKHKKIASLEDIIINYLSEEKGRTITNKVVRSLSGEDDINKVKNALIKLRKIGKIEPVDIKANAFQYAYRLK